MRQINIALQKGVILLEIIIGLLILGIILPLLVPNWSEIVGRNISERTIEETLTIWDASRNYYAENSEWPDDANSCANALTVLEAGDFIGNVGPNNAFGNAITTTCTPGAASMEIDQPVTLDWRSYVLGQLPASQDVGADRVSTIIPAPGTSAQTQSQLSRIAVSGRPELNQMETDIDMNGNDINNAANIEVTEDLTHSTTGVKLSELGPWRQYNYTSAWSSGSIPYPSCPPATTPDLNVMPVRICTSSSGALPIEQWDFLIQNNPGPETWNVRPRIFAQDNFYEPTSSICSTFKVQTYCR